MMAPRLSSGVPAPMAAPAEPPRTATDAAGAQAVITNLPALPDHLRAALQKLRADVERNCDYVGPRFADLARAMHDGRSAPRAIYGETTPGEATALAEDGIEVSAIPWVPRADA